MTMERVTRKRFLISVMLVIGMLAVTVSALASNHLLSPFTEQDLNDNWGADRQFPSGGVESVTEFGRDDVAKISIDTSEVHQTSLYHRTEGIKTPHLQPDNFDAGGNFGNAVQVDLYVDSEWEDNAVRAGLWVVGDDGDGFIDWVFGILEFANIDGHEGFRIWDPTFPGGWTDTGIEFDYGEWATLMIELDTDAGEFHFSVNGENAGTMPANDPNHPDGAESEFIRNIILNHFNFGVDHQTTLDNESYDAHWHVGIDGPVDKDDCKKGGYEDFGFKNQGQCIKFVNTGKDSR